MYEPFESSTTPRQVKALANRRIAVVLSTHDPDQAFLCADRVAILHQGRLAHLGPPREVITAENLHAIYGVAVEILPLENASGQKFLVCVPSFAQPRPSASTMP
jgi:iron complex transport system ATP-binding protein